jgi:hypothetical protein
VEHRKTTYQTNKTPIVKHCNKLEWKIHTPLIGNKMTDVETAIRDIKIHEAETECRLEIQLAVSDREESYGVAQDSYQRVMDMVNADLVRYLNSYDPHRHPDLVLVDEQKEKANLKLINHAIACLYDNRDCAEDRCRTQSTTATLKCELTIRSAKDVYNRHYSTLNVD